MAVPTNDQPKPVGEPFARVYLERGALEHESQFFRNRLDAYLQAQHYNDYAELAIYLKQEAGLVVPSSYLASVGIYYDFPKFFTETRIEFVLSAITFVWRFLRKKYGVWRTTGKGLMIGEYTYAQADAWHAFVARAMKEESMAVCANVT